MLCGGGGEAVMEGLDADVMHGFYFSAVILPSYNSVSHF